jgi:hypothetical protein
MKISGLNIPKPCSQDWEGMTPDGQGRFCGSCNKTVVDFTKMENHEIVEYLKNQGGRTCGYFLPNQVSVERPKHHQFLVNLYQNAQNGIKTTLLRNVSLALIAFCMTMVGCNSPRTTGEIEMPSDSIYSEKALIDVENNDSNNVEGTPENAEKSDSADDTKEEKPMTYIIPDTSMDMILGEAKVKYERINYSFPDSTEQKKKG